MGKTIRFSVLSRLLIAVSLLALPIIPIWILVSEGSNLEKINLVSQNINGISNSPVLFHYENENGHHTYRINLDLTNKIKPKTIDLLLATANTKPKILKSIIQSPSGSCIWKSPDQVSLEDNSIVSWVTEKCDTESVIQLNIIITLDRPTPLHIWTVEVPPGFSNWDALAKVRDTDRNFALGNVGIEINHSEIKKFELLAEIWDQKNREILLSVVIIGLFSSVIGIYLVVFYNKALKSALTVCWIGLTTTYIFLVPPLQAPDEPDHLITYTQLVNDPIFSNGILKLAQKTHFERIKFHPEQKFTANSISKPLPGDWASHIGPTDIQTRSPLTAMIWKFLDKIKPKIKPANYLIFLRGFNSIFILAIILFALSFGTGTDRKGDRAYLTILLSIPTLIFFGMHVSNYFTAISIYIVGGIVVLRTLNRNTVLQSDIFLFSICSAVAPFTNASGGATIIVWTLMLGIACAFEENNSPSLKNLLTKDCLIAFAPIIFFQAIFNRQFLEQTINSSHPIIFLISDIKSISLIPILLPLVLIFRGLLTAIPKPIENRALKYVRVGTLTALAAIVGFAVSQSLFPNFGLNLRDIENFPTKNAKLYSLLNILVFWKDFIPGKQDFYMSSTFWFGFGWLESMPHQLWQNLIRISSSLSIYYCLTAIYRKYDFARVAKITSLLISINIFLYGIAFKTSMNEVNLHGRYLIFCYVLALVLGGQGLAEILKPKIGRECNANLIKSGLVCILALIHCLTAIFLINRYF